MSSSPAKRSRATPAAKGKGKGEAKATAKAKTKAEAKAKGADVSAPAQPSAKRPRADGSGASAGAGGDAIVDPFIASCVRASGATVVSTKAATASSPWSVTIAARGGLSKVTPFREEVFKATCSVPGGCVTTYKKIAEVLGCGSNQAIGQALKNNPFAPFVPCHRVVSTDATIGGFSGSTDRDGPKIKRKVALLKSEGVVFTPSGFTLADTSQIVKPHVDVASVDKAKDKAPPRRAGPFDKFKKA